MFHFLANGNQGFVKGEDFVLDILTFIFDMESTSTASQQTSTTSQLSKDLKNFPLLLQNPDLVGSTLPTFPSKDTLYF